MATTTPNYGWDVPTSTDYVADGAVAIETLGDDIDASLFSITGGKNVGMVHLNTTSFTSAASLTIDSIFTSAYANYLIEIDSNGTAGGGDPYITFRTAGAATGGGSPTAANSYNWTRIYLGAGSFGTPAGSGQVDSTNINIGSQNCARYSSQITLFAPNMTENTRSVFQSVSTQFGGTAYSFHLTGTGYHNSNTASDGFTFTFGVTSTGVCRIYGLRNS